MKSKVLGILGTAKNTGKTTTTSVLLEIANNRNLSVGITSIGYDGEEIDNITGLPKPRVFAKRGTIIATSDRCLKAGTAKIEKLEETNFSTPLGNIAIGKITKEGLVVIAGPNKGDELSIIIEKLKRLGNELILVDGAINRIVPLMKADALILASGAARSISNDFLAKEVQCICNLFDLPKIDKKNLTNLKDIDQKVVTLIQKDNSKRFSTINSLINLSDIQELISRLDEETQLIFIPGVLTEFALNELIKEKAKLWKNKDIIIPNPSHLLIGGNTISLMDTLLKIKKFGINLKIIKTIPILAITINPFYPLYRYGNNKYESAWIDRDKLYNKVKSIVTIPVIDIVREGSDNLFNIIEKEFNH
ncbi:MAG: hypothetical protein KAW42_05070 [Candidatus Atribacteria bacterium]|nr:hypothetical protein [Candidatus Atribacteria bacterium]